MKKDMKGWTSREIDRALDLLESRIGVKNAGEFKAGLQRRYTPWQTYITRCEGTPLKQRRVDDE